MILDIFLLIGTPKVFFSLQNKSSENYFRVQESFQYSLIFKANQIVNG